MPSLAHSSFGIAGAMAMAKSRKRPHSRASTASIHSAATQPNIEQTFAENAEAYQASWVPSSLSNSLSNSLAHSHPQPRELASAPHQMTAEDMMLATHLQASRDYSMDTSMNTSMHGAQFHQSHSMNRQSMSADSFNGNASFADDSQLMDRDGHDDGDSFVGMPGAIKTGSRTSANNETEMRQLFTLNRHRTLGDVAEELHGNERGPNSERTRQIFAMLWCVAASSSLQSDEWLTLANMQAGSTLCAPRERARSQEDEYTRTTHLDVRSSE